MTNPSKKLNCQKLQARLSEIQSRLSETNEDFETKCKSLLSIEGKFPTYVKNIFISEGIFQRKS